MNRIRHRQRLARYIILFEGRSSRARFLKDLELIADAYVVAQEK